MNWTEQRPTRRRSGVPCQLQTALKLQFISTEKIQKKWRKNTEKLRENGEEKNEKHGCTKLDAAGEMIFKKKKIKRVFERFDTFFQSKQR